MSFLSKLRNVFCLVIGAAILVLLILLISGTFATGRIEPGWVALPPPIPEPLRSGEAVRDRVPIWYEAVGTVRSVTQVNVAAQITGVVLEILVNPGDTVHAGDLLVRLDDKELESRLQQAKEQLRSAEAALDRASAERERIDNLRTGRLASQRELDAALADFLQAEAEVKRAAERVEETEVALGHASLEAPSDGVVDKRLAEPGDLAFPGKVLLVVHNPEKLRLEANVREGMIERLGIHDTVAVVISTKREELLGTVAEIIPSADPISRSFVVKVDLPLVSGLFPGMFGKLRLEHGTREAVVVPREAVRYVGQLKTVLVREADGRWRRRFVCVGGEIGEQGVEILAGLDGGEVVGIR